MDARTDSHFYARFLQELTSALSTYVGDTAALIIGAITPVTTTLLAIYVMFWGWAMLRGVIQEPVLDGFGRIVRLSVIVSVALQLGIYNDYLANWIFAAPDALAGVIAGPGAKDSGTFLDQMWTKIFAFSYNYYEYSISQSGIFGMPALGYLAFAALIFVAGVFFTGYACFLFALAKISLAVTLAVGPMFVLALIFDASKKFFDAWLGQALTYVFLVMIAAAVVKLLLSILQIYMDAVKPMSGDPGFNQAIPVIVICVISGLVLVQAQSKAAHLGGGFAIASLGIVAWGVSRIHNNTTRPVVNAAGRNATKLAGYAGRKASAGVTAGSKAIYRKATGQDKNTAGSFSKS